MACLIRVVDGGPAATSHRPGWSALPADQVPDDGARRRGPARRALPQRRSAAPPFKSPTTPALTRTGRLLRATSIDELPQIWNVLRDEMSLVGPRPPLPREVDAYDPWHHRRLAVKPGITGLWQVQARQGEDFDQRVELDLEYIERWSMRLDLEILVRTIPAMFKGRDRPRRAEAPPAGRYIITRPPSTASTWPVMNAASSLTRNATAAAISSVSPNRPSGVAARSRSLRASGRSRVSSVSTKPGATALQVIDRLASSRAVALVRPMSPAFAASSWPGPSGRPARHRGDVDDPAALGLEHRPGHGLDHVEGAEQVRLEDLAPVLDRHPHDQVVAGDAGVVDQDVDLAERLEDWLDHRLGRLRAARRHPGPPAPRRPRPSTSAVPVAAAAASLPL